MSCLNWSLCVWVNWIQVSTYGWIENSVCDTDAWMGVCLNRDICITWNRRRIQFGNDEKDANASCEMYMTHWVRGICKMYMTHWVREICDMYMTHVKDADETWRMPMRRMVMRWCMYVWNKHVYAMIVDSVKTTWMHWYIYVWNKHVYATKIDSVKTNWRMVMRWYTFVWNKTCIRHENRQCEDDLKDANALIYVWIKQNMYMLRK